MCCQVAPTTTWKRSSDPSPTQSIRPRSVGQQFPVNRPLLVRRVVRLEAPVKREPTQEIVVRGIGHAASRHVDVGLGHVRVIKREAVEGEAIRPVGWRVGDHAQRGQARLGEDGGVVHEPAKVIRQGDGAVGLVAGDIVDQRFEGGAKRVFEDQFQFSIEFPKNGQVENTASGGVDAAPWLASLEHF